MWTHDNGVFFAFVVGLSVLVAVVTRYWVGYPWGQVVILSSAVLIAGLFSAVFSWIEDD